MKKEIKLTKKSFWGYILILLGLVLLTSPLVLRSYHDLRAKNEKKSFEKIEAKKSAEEIEEENKNAAAYNEMIKDADISVEDPFTSDEMFAALNKFLAYPTISPKGKRIYTNENK